MKNLLDKVVTIFVYFCVIVVAAAYFKNCFHKTTSATTQIDSTNIIEQPFEKAEHKLLENRLNKMWSNYYSETSDDECPKTFILTGSNEINAASYGSCTFLLFEALAKLEPKLIEAVLSHEIAHEDLLHNRKAAELSDLMSFVSEVVGFFGRADSQQQETISAWTYDLTIPTYSRKQEFEADKKAAEILEIVGYKDGMSTMAEALRFLLATYGNTGGGFLDHHPATQERIEALNGK